jgi:hypothetical protein
VTTPDAGAVRAALEQQRSELAPIARVLSAVATFPPRLRPEDWRGPAARACERLEQQLSRELCDAESAVAGAQRETRAAMMELGG